MISIGVDISKHTFDVACYANGKGGLAGNYPYDEKGISAFIGYLRQYGDEVLVTMEATGRYHIRLAERLHEAGFAVSIMNPLVIKRYAEMNLRRLKSDKADALLIATYGAIEKPAPFKPVSPIRRKIQEILKGIDDYTLMRTQVLGRMEALSLMPEPCEEVASCFREFLKHIKQSITALEKQLQECISMGYQQEYDLARSIPGIGKRVGALVVGMFGHFEDFAAAKQVVCYIGLTPFHRQSGSSLNRNGGISKIGNPYARRMFFLASLSASSWNSPCHALYTRLLEKGKEKKVALIAVANKLVRQVFGVIKNKRAFEEDYIGLKKTA